MKSKLILIFALLGFFGICRGRQAPGWEEWERLIGDWLGEGSGVPGQGMGTFSFRPDLDKRILVRKSHSEYPATADKPRIIHDDLMIVYPDPGGSVANAIYFDNEGHTIRYAIAYDAAAIVLTSEKKPPLPVFRLTYTLLDADTVNTEFAMSPDGEKFTTYIAGKSRRKR
jgi:hypothetical protein